MGKRNKHRGATASAFFQARVLVPIALLLPALAAAYIWYNQPEPQVRASVDVRTIVATDTVGYSRAEGPIPLRFPDDHAAHPDFKIEWWYYTGNVAAPDGRRFGYQFTLFRNALAPPDTSTRATEWGTNQLYMGHLALTDIAANRFYAFERFSRGAADLAGSHAQPFRVWLEDWEAAQAGPTMPPMRIRASEGGVQLDLMLEPMKPMVLQGDRGYSVKGPGAGNASYYYSYTRLNTTGRIETPEGSYEVQGLSWMDREWSSSLLDKHQVGWDWFSLQLTDRREIMYFIVREGGAEAQPYADGVVVQPDGSRIPLHPGELTLDAVDTWESPLDGATYPSGWRMQIPSQRIDLSIEPAIKNQEVDLSVRYWEGSVTVTGSSDGRPVDGRGYVELTGYARSSRSFDEELSDEELLSMPRDWQPGAKAPTAEPPPGDAKVGTKEPGAKRKTN